MKKENVLNVILFFLIGLVLGLSSQFIFSIFDYCVYNQVSISYLLAIGSIAISFFIYLVTTKQTDDIEFQTQSIKKQTKDINKVSKDILLLNKELNTAILGQANGFDELFRKIHDILVQVNNHDSTLKLVLPIPSIGYFNKEVRETYINYKKVLIEICSSDKPIELLFLNPFVDGTNNKVLIFFKSIIQLTNNEEYIYENSYKANLLELIKFYIDIVQSCGWRENITLRFVDDIFLSGITAANGGYKSSLFFFIGPELIECSTDVGVDKENYLSTAVYNNTDESFALLNSLIEIQKRKSKTLNLFKHMAPDMFCCFMKQIMRKIESEEGDSINRIDTIFDEYSNIFNNNSLNYIKVNTAHYYLNSQSHSKNILILPSAAGIYSHFNSGENHNIPRLNIYSELINYLDYNSYLFSFSGQGFTKNNGEFSLQKGRLDLERLDKDFEKRKIKIDVVLSFCVSNQIYFDFCKNNPQSSLANLPLLTWDFPASVAWKNNGWFRRTFSHINLNIDDLYNTVEPIEALPEKYDNKILYCFPKQTYNERDYVSMKGKLEKITKEFNVFEYENLKHIPCHLDDENEYQSLIGMINSLN